MKSLQNNLIKDVHIRKELKTYLCSLRDPSNYFVEELGICGGESRIDLALLSDEIHGFEIKSEADSLNRIEKQAVFYSRALNFATVVTAEKHLSKLIDTIPSWWGVISVAKNPDVPSDLQFSDIRSAKRNPNPDLYTVAQFLWRDEALELLKARGLDRGLRTKPRKHLWEKIASGFQTHDLFEVVASTLSSRENWRATKL